MLNAQGMYARETASTMPHYYYDNGGTHWGLWIVMIVAFLAFFSILAWVAVNIVRRKDTHDDGSSRQAPGNSDSDPRRILDERLARGEIEIDEYTRRRDLLQVGSPQKGSM
jgi:putative membrane protein